MKVVFDKVALDDLERIRRWIARDDPQRALSFVRELRQRAKRLEDRPLLFPIALRTRAGAIHKLGHGNYLLFYRVLSDRVQVLAVRHAARDTPDFG